MPWFFFLGEGVNFAPVLDLSVQTTTRLSWQLCDSNVVVCLPLLVELHIGWGSEPALWNMKTTWFPTVRNPSGSGDFLPPVSNPTVKLGLKNGVYPPWHTCPELILGACECFMGACLPVLLNGGCKCQEPRIMSGESTREKSHQVLFWLPFAC